jgi:hypothetical protein
MTIRELQLDTIKQENEIGAEQENDKIGLVSTFKNKQQQRRRKKNSFWKSLLCCGTYIVSF